jgi:hypothetical protein
MDVAAGPRLSDLFLHVTLYTSLRVEPAFFASVWRSNNKKELMIISSLVVDKIFFFSYIKTGKARWLSSNGGIDRSETTPTPISATHLVGEGGM